jgi:hypothetical protein
VPKTKPEESSSLRPPKAKKTLGLSVPPALRMPHEDLIHAEPFAPVPEYRTTEVPESPQLSGFKQQSEQITGVPEYRGTGVPRYRGTTVPESNYHKKANEVPDHLARRLTGAESKVLEQIIRLTVGFHRDERQVRVSVLQERTGYGSDKTVRTALHGLEQKGVIARIGRPNNSGGITYRILSYSGTPVPEYSGTSAESTPVLESKITGELKTPLKDKFNDDEAFALLVTQLREAAREVTGRGPSPAEAERWGELAELLATELKIAAGRTGSVSNVPAFLTEHLRRRLWKKDKRQVEAEAPESREGQSPKADAAKCPDCFGTGMWYPEGFDKGVARCGHENLIAEESPST